MNSTKAVILNFLEAPKLIKKNSLRWGYFLGVIVVWGIFIITLHFSKSVEGIIIGKLNDVFNVENHIRIVKFFLDFIIKLTVIAIFYYLYKTILMIVLAPFLSFVSEKIDTSLTGREYSFTLKENIGFIFRGIKVALKCSLKELFLTICILILGFVPIVNIGVPIYLFIIQSYFISINFVDYTLERKKMNSNETMKFMKKNRTVLCLGGAIFTLICLVPIIGVMFAPILTVVAMTKTTIEILEK